MPRMLLLTLYGNPLLGATGEDTSGAYVQDLYDLSDQIEDKLYPNRHLKILASIPRKIGAINRLQPKNTYEDINLVKVPNSFEPKLNREYRKSGGETLFAAAYKKAKLADLTGVPKPEDDEGMHFPVSTTFLTTGYTGPEMAGVEAVAGDVMSKVYVSCAGENPFFYYSVFTEQVVASLGLNSATSLMDMQDAAANFMRPRNDNEEAVPHDLFGRDIEIPQGGNSQNALRALKFALKHPLTNDRVVKMGNYARPTAATILQRHQGKSSALKALEKSISTSENGAMLPGTSSELAAGGLFSSKVAAGSKANTGEGATVTNGVYHHGYSRNRTKKYRGIRQGSNMEGTPMNVTLQQIEDVLDGLNEGMLKISSVKSIVYWYLSDMYSQVK